MFIEIAIATGATREDFDEDLSFDPGFDFGRRLKMRRSGGHVDYDNDNDNDNDNDR